MAAKKKAARKRARKRAPAPRDSRARSNKAARVARCLELMSTGQWRTGVSGALVAAEFGVSPATLRTDAAEASRMLRGTFDAEELATKKVRLLATLEHATEMASKGRSARELKDCAQAELEALGLMPEKKFEHNVRGNLAELLALGDGEGGEPPAGPVEE